MLRCTNCRIEKPEESFRRNGRKKNGFDSWCEGCHAAASLASYHKNKPPVTAPKKLAYIKNWYATRSDAQRLKDRAHGVAKNTGMSKAAALQILTRSPPVVGCAICEVLVSVRPPVACEQSCEGLPTAHVDHCHSTGTVRGFLCGTCNTAIGHLRDNPSLLRKAAAYLDSFEMFK